MDCEQVRNNIDILLKKHEINYQQVSLMLGKPAGWMHQFIKRKSPKRLNEIDRKNLAVILNVPEQELTDIDLSAPALPVSFSGVQTLADIIASGVFSLVQKFADKKTTSSLLIYWMRPPVAVPVLRIYPKTLPANGLCPWLIFGK